MASAANWIQQQRIRVCVSQCMDAVCMCSMCMGVCVWMCSICVHGFVLWVCMCMRVFIRACVCKCSMWLFESVCSVCVCVSLDSAQHEQQLQPPNHSLSCTALSSGGWIDSDIICIIYGSIGTSWQPFSIHFLFLLNNKIGIFACQNTPLFHTCPDLNDNTLIHLHPSPPSSHPLSPSIDTGWCRPTMSTPQMSDAHANKGRPCKTGN